MDFLKIFEERQSKDLNTEIVSYIGQHPEKMKDLMHVFLEGSFRLNQRAAWPIGIIGEKHPHLIEPFLPSMLKKLEEKGIHDAVIRNTLRTLQTCPIPEDLEGEIYEKCFNYLIDLKRPIAIRVFSMTVLARIADKFPELRDELVSVIKDQYELGSSGYKARARKVLRELKVES